jgi:hypothetical protein
VAHQGQVPSQGAAHSSLGCHEGGYGGQKVRQQEIARAKVRIEELSIADSASTITSGR